MAGGQERILRRRIRSIQSTKKITKAMELIAASQIVRAQGRIAAARPYQRGHGPHRARDRARRPEAAGRLLGTPETVDKVAVLVRGGRPRAVRRLQHLGAAGPPSGCMAERRAGGIEYRLFTVGKKAQGYFRFRGQPVERSFTGMSERPTFADARAVAAAVLTPFVDGEVDQVLVVSTRFLSAGTQKVEVRQLLPLVDPRARRATRSAGGRGRRRAGPAPATGPPATPSSSPTPPSCSRPWPRGRPRPRSSPPCSRRRPPRSPPGSGPWPPPPTTPAS